MSDSNLTVQEVNDKQLSEQLDTIQYYENCLIENEEGSLGFNYSEMMALTHKFLNQSKNK